jgi:hypothetical protein
VNHPLVVLLSLIAILCSMNLNPTITSHRDDNRATQLIRLVNRRPHYLLHLTLVIEVSVTENAITPLA